MVEWTFEFDKGIERFLLSMLESGGPLWQDRVLRKGRTLEKALRERIFDRTTRLDSLAGDAQVHFVRGLGEGEPCCEVGVIVTRSGAFAFHMERYRNEQERQDVRGRIRAAAPEALRQMQARKRYG
jgi:hypothetical protein